MLAFLVKRVGNAILVMLTVAFLRLSDLSVSR